MVESIYEFIAGHVAPIPIVEGVEGGHGFWGVILFIFINGLIVGGAITIFSLLNKHLGFVVSLVGYTWLVIIDLVAWKVRGPVGWLILGIISAIGTVVILINQIKVIKNS